MPDDVVAVPAIAVPGATEPHPLAEGGKRFNEVYAEMKAAQRTTEALQAELAAERSVRQSAVTSPAQQPFFTAEELQALVDAGKITPAKMAEQAAWQSGQQVEQRLRQQYAVGETLRAARDEVNQYLAAAPALQMSSSPELLDVARSARELSQEMRLPVTDFRVQRRALRETLGPLNRLVQARSSHDLTRSQDPFSEAGGGGSMRHDPNVKPDPFKDVPAVQLAHWKKLNYTEAQMLKELPRVLARVARLAAQ